MTTMNVRDESVWATENEGAEYTAEVPFEHPRFPHGTLTVLMVCDGQAFTPEDRDHAQRRLEGLPHRLDSIFARMREHVGLRGEHEFLADQGTPTLMLYSGDQNRWVFAMEALTPATSLFVEWDRDQIVGVWTSV